MCSHILSLTGKKISNIGFGNHLYKKWYSTVRRNVTITPIIFIFFITITILIIWKKVFFYLQHLFFYYYGYRAVVYEGYFHICSKDTGLRLYVVLGKFFIELFIEFNGFISGKGIYITGTTAFFVSAYSVNWLTDSISPLISNRLLFITPFSSSNILRFTILSTI